MKRIVLAVAVMAAFVLPASAQARLPESARVLMGHKHMTAHFELRLSNRTIVYAQNVLGFLKQNPGAGTKHSRAVVRHNHTWLLKFGKNHKSHALWRLRPRYTRPSVDGCLSTLISRESGWRVTATNPLTGAYGLPQALPGSKMASAGSDWRTNAVTQIRWMLGYIAGRYGSTCAALSFQIANGYY